MAQYTYLYDPITPANEDFIALAVGQGVDAPNGSTLEDEITGAGLPAADTIAVYFDPDNEVVITFASALSTAQQNDLLAVVHVHTGLGEGGDAPPDPGDLESIDHSELHHLDADDHKQYLTIIYGSDNPNYLGTVAEQGRVFRDTVLGVSYRQMDSPSGSNWKVTS